MVNNQDALGDIRIVDFTWVLAGPYAARILADSGAEVIKIQSRVTMGAESPNNEGYFITWNRNKRGITLNLSKPEGRDIARRLIQVSDAVVENFTPRVMRNWGLDYSTLSRTRPGLIMLSMSGMGQTGVQQNYSAFGPTIQALSGITQLTTFPHHPPLGIGYSYADHIAGLAGALSLLAALEYRHRTGRGQHIDLSELEAMSGLMGIELLNLAVNHKIATPVGNHPLYHQAAPYGIYRCKGEDKWCAIAIFTEEEWEVLCHVMGNPRWTAEARFADLRSRVNNRDKLDELVEEWTTQHEALEVMERLQKYGIAAGVVQDASDLAHDPQLGARDFFTQMGHPARGSVTVDGSPMKFSRTPIRFHHSAPLLGQDNNYVYGKLLGMSQEEIKRYTEMGIFY